MVKFYFKAVSVIAIALNLGMRGVALGTYAYIPEGLAVDSDRAGRVFLIGAGADKAVPVVHYNIKGVDCAGIKKPVFIAHRLRGIF